MLILKDIKCLPTPATYIFCRDIGFCLRLYGFSFQIQRCSRNVVFFRFKAHTINYAISHSQESCVCVWVLKYGIDQQECTCKLKPTKNMVLFMVFNATFNNILVISCQSVLLVVETGVPGGNHRPAASHGQTLSHNIVSRTPRLSEVRTQNVSGDRYRQHRQL